MPNVEVTGAARLHRAASSDRRERGRLPGWGSVGIWKLQSYAAEKSALATRRKDKQLNAAAMGCDYSSAMTSATKIVHSSQMKALAPATNFRT